MRNKLLDQAKPPVDGRPVPLDEAEQANPEALGYAGAPARASKRWSTLEDREPGRNLAFLKRRWLVYATHSGCRAVATYLAWRSVHQLAAEFRVLLSVPD